MQQIFKLAAIFFLTFIGCLTIYNLLKLSLYQFRGLILAGSRQEIRFYRPDFGPIIGFSIVGSVVAILVGGLILGNPIYGLPAIPLVSLLALPVVAYHKEEKRFRTERQALSFLHGLHGLTQGGVTLPSAIDCLTRGEKSDFDVVVQRRLKTFSKGESIKSILEETRKNLGLKSLDVCLGALELAYERGLSISTVLSEALPALEAETEMLKRTRNLRKSVVVQAVLASFLPWTLLSVLYFFQPEMMIGFITTSMAAFAIGFSIFWMGLGVFLLWSISEFY